MGATTFQTSIIDRGLTPEAAYKRLVDEALYEYGHDPYNGTISTTDGFVMIDPNGRKIDNVIREITDNESHQVNKWGPAGCIEIKGKALRDWKERAGLKGTRARGYVFFGWAAE